MNSKAFHLDTKKFSDGGLILRINWRQGVFVLFAFFGSLVIASAQTRTGQQSESVVTTLITWIPFILKGFGLNLLMSIIAMALATILGIALGIMQVSRTAFFRLPARFVTLLFRNSPWLVILFLVMFLVPIEIRLLGAKIMIPDWIKATFAFSLPVLANISEIVRGAINSIPRGQWESAESLAFTRSQTLRWIILPQCVKRAIPPWMNWYALLALSTPMASILGVNEALGNAQSAMEASGARPEFLIPFYLFLLCLFFAYIYPIALWTRRIEHKYAVVN